MSGELQYPKWQEPLQEAILSIASPGFAHKLRQAQIMIQGMLQEFPQTGSSDERQALVDALATIGTIRQTG